MMEVNTSEAVTVNASQSTRGSIFSSSVGLGSIVSETSSHSFGWRGKQALLDLQALTAQVTKLRVKTFILALCNMDLCVCCDSYVVEWICDVVNELFWQGDRGVDKIRFER